MAKRFTATEKWDDPFFCELDNTYKLVWTYLLDKCDNAGVYDVNIRLMKFHIAGDFTEEKLLKTFENRIEILNGGSKWFIPKFIEFQYGELNSNCRPHISVIEKLKKHRIKGYAKGIHTLQAQDKDKDKDKEKDKDIPTETEFLDYCKTLSIYHPSFDFQIKAKYQSWIENKWKDGNNKPIKNWKTKIQNVMPYFKKDMSKVEAKVSPVNKACVHCGKKTTTVISGQPVCNYDHLTKYQGKNASN